MSTKLKKLKQVCTNLIPLPIRHWPDLIKLSGNWRCSEHKQWTVEELKLYRCLEAYNQMVGG